MEGVAEYIIGTPEFIAPEIIRGEYNNQKVDFGPPVDMWSLGVILYILLIGNSPFLANNTDAVFDLIKKGEYSLDASVVREISSEGKDLITKLFELDPSRRITASEALRHPWITEFHELSKKTLPHVAARIKRFNARIKFRMGIRAVIASNRFMKYSIDKRQKIVNDVLYSFQKK